MANDGEEEGGKYMDKQARFSKIFFQIFKIFKDKLL
jgi:hypothetical protein